MKKNPLGEWLRQAMDERDTTMRAVGEATGLSHVTIYNAIHGQYTPQPGTCIKLAQVLGEDPDYVLELAGHRKPRDYNYMVDFPTYVKREFPDKPQLRKALMDVYNAWMRLEAGGRSMQ